MPHTGRAVHSRKWSVEEGRAIDVALLRAKGFFGREAGIVWTSSWTYSGKPWGEVSYRREDYAGKPFLLWFKYNVQKDGGEWRPVNYCVEIESTRCHFGGLRHWFICPILVDGRSCGRRCRCLYLAGNAEYFGCRECLRLSYQSRRLHRKSSWEEGGKQSVYLERAHQKFKNPRGRKAKARRARLLATANREMWYWDALLDRLLRSLGA